MQDDVNVQPAKTLIEQYVEALVDLNGWLVSASMDKQMRRQVTRMREFRSLRQVYNSLAALIEDDVKVSPYLDPMDVDRAKHQIKWLLKGVRERQLYPLGKNSAEYLKWDVCVDKTQ